MSRVTLLGSTGFLALKLSLDFLQPTCIGLESVVEELRNIFFDFFSCSVYCFALLRLITVMLIVDDLLIFLF